MKNRKYIALFLALILSFSLSNISTPVYAKKNKSTSIYILNEEDFIKFSKKASLEDYTKNKDINLIRDLDFTGMDFDPIPIFAGNFDGKGHEIRGIYFASSGSKQGFCRINKGRIKNLKVIAKFAPIGSAQNVGIIAGENYGIIENCSANGEIKAKTNAGGIVGKNFATTRLEGINEDGIPLIKDCTSKVRITCTINAGGIAGENLGEIKTSKNEGSINTSETQINTTKIPTIEDIKNEFLSYEENSTLDVFSSAGGICGKNTGTISDSKNKGNVGYIHLGKNVGGITGLNNGIIKKCENKGTIHGREAVGGITGQFEPDLKLEFSRAKVADLKTQISLLISYLSDANFQVNTASTNALNKSNEINTSLNSIENTLKNTGTGINEFSKEKIDIIYTSVEEINKINSSILDDYHKYSKLILDDSDTARLIISDIINELDIAIENLNDNVDKSNKALKDSKLVLTEQRDRLIALKTNFDNINKRIKEKSRIIDTSLTNLNAGIQALEAALTGVDDLATLFLQMEAINEALNTILSTLSDLAEIFQGIFTGSTTDIDEIINVGFDALEISGKELENLATSLGANAENIVNVNKSAQKNIKASRSKLNETFDNLDKNSKELNEALNSHLQNDNKHIGNIEKIVKEEYDYLNSSLHTSYDDIYKDVIYINSELSTLIADTQTSRGDLNTTNVNIISTMNQINEIVSELIKAPEYTYENLYDIESDSNTTLKNGTIALSTNNGLIEGDSHTGGIAGKIAFDIKNDPKNLFTENSKLWRDTKAYLRAIIYKSKNNASITSKNDYAGGLVGRADTGIIISSLNKGNISGINYLGGIAGYSLGRIESCDVLCDIDGKNNLGGIAGYGEWLKENNCMIRINSDGEKLGSIAGEVNNLKDIYENHFVDEGLGAIDGISHFKEAYPLSYENFIKKEDLPKYYSTIYVRFYDDEKLIKSVIVKYGASIAKDKIPPVPIDKNGYTQWADFTKTNITRTQDVELEHKKFISTIEARDWTDSYVSSQNKKPIFLAEGKFLPEDALIIEPLPIPDSIEDKTGKTAYHYEINTNDKIQNASYKIRVQLGEKEAIKSIENSKVKDIDFTMDGTYAVFSTDASGEILIFPKTDYKKHIIYAGIALAILLLVIILIIKNRKSKKKKAKATNLKKDEVSEDSEDETSQDVEA